MAYQPILNPMPVSQSGSPWGVVLNAGAAAIGSVTVTGSVAVTGTFWQATQPVSLTSTTITGSVAVTGTFYQATQPVSGTFWQATQPVSLTSTTITGTTAISAASLPLPAGAATAAKQPALGTAGTASADVITVQGIASGTVIPVSLTSTTITGTVAATQSGTWNIGTVTTLPALPANQSVNVAQMNGVAVTVGSGVTGTGVQRVVLATDVPLPGNETAATFRGRSQTFRTPGLAGTAGQKLFAIHNATGSTKVVHINQITIDCMQTVAKALTVAPPVIRIHRFTAIPTGGTAGAKTAKDTALTSNASITTWQSASADGTSTTLAVTIPASSMITQEFAPRSLLTGTAASAFYEPFDRATYLEGYDIVLRALEGLVVFLDYTLATQNPITDMWTVGCDWWEV